MIKANELRLGNYIKVINAGPATDLKDKIAVVVGVYKADVDRKYRIVLHDGRFSYEFKEEDLSGVALSVDLIEKIGFKEAGDAHLLNTYGFHIWCRTEHEDAWISEIDDVDVEKRDIWYLHRFQNIFFSLMHKELVIDIKNIKQP